MEAIWEGVSCRFLEGNSWSIGSCCGAKCTTKATDDLKDENDDSLEVKWNLWRKGSYKVLLQDMNWGWHFDRALICQCSLPSKLLYCNFFTILAAIFQICKKRKLNHLLQIFLVGFGYDFAFPALKCGVTQRWWAGCNQAAEGLLSACGWYTISFPHAGWWQAKMHSWTSRTWIRIDVQLQ